MLLQEDETQKSAIMIDLDKKNESSATTIGIDEKKELTPLPQKLLEACRSNEDDNGKVDTEVVTGCHWHWRYDYTTLCTLCTPMYTMYSMPPPRKKLLQRKLLLEKLASSS
ncbi:MAG: hypothetical protein GY830_05300 [Bacteroidetes bacterium]|nr:hypothetical protein [Bacteroidota bacterium]